jgi:hypothetical protein
MTATVDREVYGRAMDDCSGASTNQLVDSMLVNLAMD